VREVTSKVLNILAKHHIKKPFYHGGKYNGKAMVKLMEYKNILCVFDGVFTVARKPSGTVTSEDQIAQLLASITTAMTLWRGLGLSVAPKPHAMEDYLVEQIRQFKGIGDLYEDFIENKTE
jgi:hypothetical protein